MNFKKVKTAVSLVKARVEPLAAKAGSVAGSLVISGLARADAGTITVDTTDMLANIAAGLAAALLVSAAMTAAVIGIRASKMPRRGS